MKIKNLSKNILSKPSTYFFIFFIFFTFDRHHRWESTKDDSMGPFYDDAAQYYSFLPDYFINGESALIQNFKTNKRTIGMAIMYSPFFLLGHSIAHYNDFPTNGYSKPYQRSIRWGSIVYCFLGLIFCRKALLLFFNEIIVSISLFCILFGTNLFFYTYAHGEMPHNYLFFLFSIFIYCTIKYVDNKKITHLFILAFTGGIITLIRPTDLLIFLFPLLYQISSLNELMNRIKHFISKPIVTTISLLLFFIPLLVQGFFWKKYIGHPIYYSYGNERFFFNDPQIMNFLFSFRKGWLLYTPMMIFSLIGIIISKKTLKDFFIFLVIFFLLNVYILSSWWDWAYGGSFGCRVLIESYAILIFPLAAFISRIWELSYTRVIVKKAVRSLLLVILFLLIKLNLFQSWQFKYLIIHWDGMNKKIYTQVFLQDKFSEKELKYFHSIASIPDYDKMLLGKRDQ